MSENDLPEELSVSPPGRYRPPGYASADKRRRAIALFEAGIGYTKASRILDLPSTTLRDWAEAWKNGTINGGAARQEAHLRPRRPQDPKSAEGTA
ncbi:helix-turn-helix domain-containing protein [Sutterella wadsworthensis]|uniref:helix-turn-helix domain-containing protein n=1 Tax=Sutterella wadsworthensis TaxID=40545 RepID=UPI00402AEC3A